MKYYLLLFLAVMCLSVGIVSLFFAITLTDFYFMLYGILALVLAVIIDTYNRIDNNNYY